MVSDYNKYKTAITLFKQKYRNLPGDMPNATAIWGADSGCPTPTANRIPKQATCNGNGDSFIGDSSGIDPASEVNYSESLHSWQHLSNAGFIEGKYTGAISTISDRLEPGINMPETPYVGNTFYLRFLRESYYTIFSVGASHKLVFGSAKIASDIGTPYGIPNSANSIMKPQEAYAIDLKIDDGDPSQGIMTSSKTDYCATQVSGKWNYNFTQDPSATYSIKFCIYYFDLRF